MDPHSPNKLFATKYCFLIPGDDTSFFFFISLSFGFLLFYVIIDFYINYFILFIFIHENYFYFFMFRDVPGCSGMFRHVPACSGMFHVPGFIDAREVIVKYFLLITHTEMPI